MSARVAFACSLLLAACRAERARPPGACGETARPPGVVVIAGSGSGLALVGALVRRYRAAYPDARIELAESIGTTGGLRALADGAIDLAIASRSLTETEKPGNQVHPLARVVTAFTTSADVTSITSAELAEIYAGRRRTWPDGSRIVPFVRQAGDSANTLIAAHLPALGRAIEAALGAGSLPVAYTDQELAAALLSVSGSLGTLDLGTLRLNALPLHALSLDGVAPEREAALAGRYPLIATLALVSRGAPAGEAARFLDFVASDAVADLFEGPILRAR